MGTVVRMEIEAMVISTETITPSSPTPKSLQKHHLSFIDQLMPPLFMSFVYFYYPSNPIIPNSQKSKQLKKSLSEILPRYYPLAGRIVGNLYVDCNDAGVPFSEAQSDCDVSQAITNKNPKDVQKFLPYKTDDPRDFCMAVQATHFRCGGLAVGILLSHKIADGLSFISFVNTWSAVVRNGDDCGDVPLPKFDAAAYFPPMNIFGFQPPTGREEEGVATCRILTFPAAMIAALREKYSDGGRRPSRVEALSAFIWTRFTSATGMTSDPRRICNVRSPVNLRNRGDPPLSEYHFGNLIGNAVAKAAAGDGGVEFIHKVREAVDGFVALMKNGDKYVREMIAEANNTTELVGINFSSITKFPLYQVDFGWGRPDWVGLGPVHHKNLVMFMDTKSGDGIQALICLTKQDMEKFQAHLNLKLQIFKSNM